ncbi:enoyl-CoA hydratase/isomerase family protein [Algimonas porphyrae]|uniref:Enoyl-CoA hydratase n=1 Tax=Algimonas porphyrae TaxID=1128113 RepID=A0ABQ5V243_9PROT|nr:enoyl-CoA hydratase/isomerase family protein [Algimonas porphyrae]GLQ21523.1 enoyl-CoA hydratase [Algimonas porphyrae]
MSDQSASDLVSYEMDGHVAIITLNRPEVMNAMNKAVRKALRAAQTRAEHDDQVRVVVLTGSGRAFSSGTDLKESASFASEHGQFDNSIRDYKPLVDGIAKSDKIYIAAINGFAGGVALGLALGSDLAVMADDATIFSPFIGIGLVPDGGASWFYLHHLGYKRAFAAMAEGTRLDARTCLEAGMVNKVVPAGDLRMDAIAWAQSLAEKAPLALRSLKRIMREATHSTQEQTARLESEHQMIMANTDDSREGIMAFVQKRKPDFKGR